MAIKKEVIISTEKVNCYGARVLTAGINIEQYKKNPVLLYMHERWGRENAPIGRVDNLRVDNKRLIGTPVFDLNDPSAKLIADKWDNDFLRMVSPRLEIIEYSEAPEMLVAGQTRPTITRCKLAEVSVVDIAGNDDALALSFESNGKVLTLATGDNCDALPLLKLNQTSTEDNNVIPNKKNEQMKSILLALGLSDTATGEQAVAAIAALKKTAADADIVVLAAITSTVSAAVAANKITADKTDHFISLGKTMGIDALNKTLELMTPVRKPIDIIDQNATHKAGAVELKWSDLTPESAEKLKASDVDKYALLYKSEFGVMPTMTV